MSIQDIDLENTAGIMIDDATGRTSKIGYEFFDFVSEYVFKPLMIK